MSPADVVLSPPRTPTAGSCGWTPSTPSSSTTPATTSPAWSSSKRPGRQQQEPWEEPPCSPRLTSELVQYAELDIPCIIEAAPHPTHSPGLTTVHITGHQRGQTVFTCTVTAADAA